MDFTDGVAFCNLLEIISAKKLTKWNPKPRMKPQKLENAGIGLEFLHRGERSSASLVPRLLSFVAVVCSFVAVLCSFVAVLVCCRVVLVCCRLVLVCCRLVLVCCRVTRLLPCFARLLLRCVCN